MLFNCNQAYVIILNLFVLSLSKIELICIFCLIYESITLILTGSFILYAADQEFLALSIHIFVLLKQEFSPP